MASLIDQSVKGKVPVNCFEEHFIFTTCLKLNDTQEGVKWV